jgi:hypothetical protein
VAAARDSTDLILKRASHVKIVILPMYSTQEGAWRAFQSGARARFVGIPDILMYGSLHRAAEFVVRFGGLNLPNTSAIRQYERSRKWSLSKKQGGIICWQRFPMPNWRVSPSK